MSAATARELLALAATAAELGRLADQRCRDAATGRAIDLGEMTRQVTRLCAGAEALGADAAGAIRPAIAALIASIEDMASAVDAARAEAASGAILIADQRKARAGRSS